MMEEYGLDESSSSSEMIMEEKESESESGEEDKSNDKSLKLINRQISTL